MIQKNKKKMKNVYVKLKEQKKYILKFGSLSEEKTEIAKDQKINKEILLNNIITKI